MKTIELSAALASAPVQENLKNFAGLDAQNALGLMTPERLAAVAGEKLGLCVSRDLVSVNSISDPANVAKTIITALPNDKGAIIFNILFSCDGKHYAHGFVYGDKMYGVIHISILYGDRYTVVLNNGNYIVK